MEANNLVLSLPAVIALVFKVILILYAGRSPRQNAETHIFLYFLFALSLLNVAEIMIFAGRASGGIPIVALTLYFAAAIPALAICAHLFLLVATDFGQSRYRIAVLTGLYAYAVALEILLFSGPWLISGFTPIGYSFYRSAGPLYFLFEFYAIACLVVTLLLLVYGSLRGSNQQQKTKCQLMLVAITPTASIGMTNILLMHYEITWLNTPLVLPLAITFFLVVATYAIHQHRLFDIQFFIPWSKVRKRKTAFYNRIRSMIVEVADLVSVNQAVERLADTLRCPVALLGGPRPVLAEAEAKQMITIPVDHLRQIDQIVVANEIAESLPETYALMRQHGIAAIVPFYPHSQNAASWLLLGDSFSEQVYTPLDFRLVEELFDKMAELFLDKLLAMRTQLADAQRQIRTLEQRLQTIETALSMTQQRVDVLSRENARLVREQPADSLLLATEQARTKASITLLGRDKDMLKRLREHFPQADCFAGPQSMSFRRQNPADLLICPLEQSAATVERHLLSVIASEKRPRSILFYGERASEFAFEHRSTLRGMIAEVLPSHCTDEVLARKAQALIETGRALHSVSDVDYPLIGRSSAYQELMSEAKRMAGLLEPAFIKSKDAGEAMALATYMHELSGSSGKLVLARVTTLGEEPETAAANLLGLLHQAQGGTLMLDDVCALPNANWHSLMSETVELSHVRIIAGCTLETSQSPAQLMRPLRPLVLEIPSFEDRRADIPLLVHYFTLQFNLQSRAPRYLSQAEMDDMIGNQQIRGLSDLKSTVYTRLAAGNAADVARPLIDFESQGRTLDEYLAEFEARLIEQTLKRCGGNKSRAARLLGLRPNTLHYKLERYGLHRKN